MIGAEWIRQKLPRDWAIARVRDHVSITNGYPFDSKLFSASDGMPLVRIRDISSEAATILYAGAPVSEAMIKNGDILVGMDGDFNVAMWKGGPALLNQRVCKLEPHDTVDRRFLLYMLPTPLRLINEFTYSTTVKHLSSFDIEKIRFPYPELHVQRAVAAYLDRETADIDALVAAKQRLLDLLSEKRRAIVAKAVMRGVNPSAPMRPSGIAWVGDIPAHWEMKRSKWLFEERDERSADGSETLLSLRMERGLVPHNDVSEKPTRPEELIGYKKTSVGEVVVNRMRAATGLIAITEQDGLVSPDYAVFCPSSNISAAYYVEMFKTPLLQAVFRSESTGLGTGSQGFLRLYSQNFLALWFPCPPLEEQLEIVSYVGTETAKIERLRTAAEHTIKLLRERRSALIAAAVTGQIEIPEAA